MTSSTLIGGPDGRNQRDLHDGVPRMARGVAVSALERRATLSVSLEPRNDQSDNTRPLHPRQSSSHARG